jgi:peptidyl-prolyl cis-trans isomerase B (cyclophilin B)
VVTGAGAGLTPDYALLGRVTKGMKVVQEIGQLGDPASGGAGTPLQSVAIEETIVRER